MPPSKLDIQFGRRTRKLAGYDAPFPQIVFAQLVAIGFEPNEAAWVCYYGMSKLATQEQVHSKAQTAMKLKKVQELLAHFREELKTTSVTPDGEEEETGMDADQTADEMLRIARTLPDGKERADLMMKYADLKGFKKASGEVKSDKKSVAFFLPVNCSTCPCYQYALENGGKDKKPLHSSKV